MNASFAFERAQAAEQFHREHAGEANLAHAAACFSVAAEQLATASRSWRTLPPSTRVEIDNVAAQLEGCRHSLIGLRTSLGK